MTPEDYREMVKELKIENDWDPEHQRRLVEAWQIRWDALKLWLREARGRDYVTRTPAVVLQKMADLEEAS